MRRAAAARGHIQTAGGQDSDPASVDFPIFYVKRYSIPQQASTNDLRMLRFAAPSADLFMRSNASPSGIETNITARITGTGTTTPANYDVKDVSASPDGTTHPVCDARPAGREHQSDQRRRRGACGNT